MAKSSTTGRYHRLPELSDEELATVLAALSYWQRTVCSGEYAKTLWPEPESVYFTDAEPITADAIDDLKDKINVQGNA